MFTALFTFFYNLWVWVKNLFEGVWSYCKYGYVWLVGLLYAFMVAWNEVGQFIRNQVDYLSQVAGNLSVTGGGNIANTQVGNFFHVINTFFPLSEFFTLLETWSVLGLTMLIYRFIKSWIPTLS